MHVYVIKLYFEKGMINTKLGLVVPGWRVASRDIQKRSPGGLQYIRLHASQYTNGFKHSLFKDGW